MTTKHAAKGKCEIYIPPHQECWTRWGEKCKWEHMSRTAVLKDWPDIICEDCQQEWDRVQAVNAARNQKGMV